LKRVLAFLVAIGVIIGVFVVLKEANSTTKIDKPLEESGDNEIYIDELNLPLVELDTMNPLLTKNKQVSDTLKLIYEPLFDLDEKNKLEPRLATEWHEKDELTWIIKLNTKAKWHNGKSFSADDVMFTYQTILQNESVYKENIKNIFSLEKIDENAIQIQLIGKDKYFLYQLIFPIIPKHYFENDLLNETKLLQPNGTGPYQYHTISEDKKIITLIANNNWWNDEKFKLNTIYLYQYATYGEAMKAFKSTEIDVISTTMSSWQKKFGAIGNNAYSYESSEFETIIPNTQNIMLKESSVRRMILAGINSANIVETIYQGNGKVSQYPITSNSYLNFYPDEKSYDIEKAKQLLVNAGWQNETGFWKKEINGKVYTLDFDLLVQANSEEKIEIAKLIQSNLEEIGVKIKIIKADEKEFKKRIEEYKFELALVTFYLDMDMDILELIQTNSTKNFANYQNTEIDNFIAEINMENLEEKFLAIQNLYKNEAPYIGMYYKCNNLLTNKSVKGDINPTSWNVYHNIIGWCK